MGWVTLYDNLYLLRSDPLKLYFTLCYRSYQSLSHLEHLYQDYFKNLANISFENKSLVSDVTVK